MLRRTRITRKTWQYLAVIVALVSCASDCHDIGVEHPVLAWLEYDTGIHFPAGSIDCLDEFAGSDDGYQIRANVNIASTSHFTKCELFADNSTTLITRVEFQFRAHGSDSVLARLMRYSSGLDMICRVDSSQGMTPPMATPILVVWRLPNMRAIGVVGYLVLEGSTGNSTFVPNSLHIIYDWLRSPLDRRRSVNDSITVRAILDDHMDRIAL